MRKRESEISMNHYEKLYERIDFKNFIENFTITNNTDYFVHTVVTENDQRQYFSNSAVNSRKSL